MPRCLFGSFVAIAIAVAVGVWVLSPRTAITRENAELIRVGMTIAEVETLLDGPGRDETAGLGWSLYNGMNTSPVFQDMTIRQEAWLGPQCCVMVAFEQGRVLETVVGETLWRETTIMEKLIRWFQLR